MFRVSHEFIPTPAQLRAMRTKQDEGEVFGEHPGSSVDFVAVPSAISSGGDTVIYNPGSVLKQIKKDPKPGDLEEIQVTGLRSYAHYREIIVRRARENAPLLVVGVISVTTGVIAYKAAKYFAQRGRKSKG